jgi:hypothetical protein
MTQNNEAARYFSNQPEVGAWLCHNCHVYETNSPENIDKMFQQLYMVWSYEIVKFWHEKICSYLTSGKPFRIPKKDKTLMPKEPASKYYGYVVYDKDLLFKYAAAGYSPPVLDDGDTACVHKYKSIIGAIRAVHRYERIFNVK